MKIAAIADTYAALGYLGADKKLSDFARCSIESAANNEQKVGISSITLVEMVYLIEKGRLASSTYNELSEAITDPEHVLTEVPFTSVIVESMRSIPRDQVPDMPDRIIAATALYLGVPIISRDRQISSALLETLW